MLTKANLALALDRCWFIEPHYANARLLELAEIPGDAMLRTPTLEAYVQARIDAFAVGTPQPKAEDRRPYPTVDGVALIELSGPLLESPPSMADATSTIFARRQVRTAANDDQVKEILLLINSPGGQCAGLGNLADDVKLAGEKKSTVAFLSSQATSAAYYLASQCGVVVASPYCVVGSIGVYGVMFDVTGLFEMAGVAAHLVSSGGIKGMGHPGTPVTEEVVAELQKSVDAYMSQFVSAVASGRGMSESRVRELGTGQCWTAQEALSLGLIDAIGSEDDVLSGLMAARAARS